MSDSYRLLVDGAFVWNPDFRRRGDPSSPTDNYDEVAINIGVESPALWSAPSYLNREDFQGGLTGSLGFKTSYGDVHTRGSRRYHADFLVGLHQHLLNWLSEEGKNK